MNLINRSLVIRRIAGAIAATLLLAACGGQGATLPSRDSVGLEPTSQVNSAPSLDAIGPRAVLSPTSLNFGRPGTQNLHLSNPGTAPLLIRKIVASGCHGFGQYFVCFTQTNDCPGTLRKDTACTIAVDFTYGHVAGTFTGTVSVYDNAPGSPQVCTLTGTAPCTPLGRPCGSSFPPCCPGLVCQGASVGNYCEPASNSQRGTYRVAYP